MGKSGSFILRGLKTAPFRARINCGRSSIPPEGRRQGTLGFSPRGSIIFFILLNFCLFLFASGSFAYAQEMEKPPLITLTTAVLGVIPSGDREKFEEDHWVWRNTSGGIEDFNYLKEYKNGDSLEAAGRVNPNNNDYVLNLDYAKEGVGSFKFTFKDFRKYYDGTGGFYSGFVSTVASPNTYFDISKNLHLDIGSFKLEGILAKEGEPRYSLSYERLFKDGDKSLLMWNSVIGAGTLERKIYPNSLQLKESVDRVKLGVEHTIKNINVSAEQDYEHGSAKNNNVYRQTMTLSTGLVTGTRTEYDKFDYDQYSTLLRLDKTWANNVFSSLGFMFNRYVGGSTESITDAGITNTYLPSPADIEQDSIVLLPNVSFSPVKDLLLDVGLRIEYTKKNAYSSFNLDSDNDGVINRVTNVKTGREDSKFAQNFEFKYSKFKNAVFYSEADFEQRFIDLHELQAVTGAFDRLTNASEYDNRFTIGSKWYLLSNLDAVVEFTDKIGLREYKHNARAGIGASDYPSLIDTLQFMTYYPVLKLNYKPSRWISFNFGYNYETTSYGIRTLISDALEMQNHKAHVYSISATLTPRDSMYLALFYTRKNAATVTRANGQGGSTTIVPTYNGNYNVLGCSFSYAPDRKNTITGNYSMSRADNFNDFSATGMPLGLDNFSQSISMGIEHQLRKDLSLEFRYTHDEYTEDSNNGIDNYDANLFYTGLKMKF